jgi:serine/threonine-protein kinase HipA
MREACEIHVQLPGRGPVRAGTLYAHRRQGRESASFSYASSWIADADAYALDPLLPLGEGAFHTNHRQAMFGAFSDAAPDTWGRNLIRRGERHRARSLDRAERSYGEFGYLMEVRDDVRHGAVRCRADGAFRAIDDDGVPHLVELPRLLEATGRLERDAEQDEDLRILLRGGSSLGGARPKAHVIDADGALSIAKLPSRVHDEWNVMAWERVALVLAERAGIDTPSSELCRVDGRDVLIVRRFDRRGSDRVGYVSAMTMLEAIDGDTRSYLEIADIVTEHSSRAAHDLEELWRRVALSILISNCDDHLRNHGFLRDGPGWRLSPVFDINPNPGPEGRQLRTSIDFDGASADISRLVDVADYFRLGIEDARRVLGDVLAAVESWRQVAHDVGLPSAELDRMRPAFERDQIAVARAFVDAS